MTTGRHVVGADPDLRGDLREADHLLHGLAAELALPDGAIACTHAVRDGRPRLGFSFALPTADAARALRERLGRTRQGWGVALGGHRDGPAALAAGAAHAAAEHEARSAGRAVLYPGAGGLTGTVTVASLLTSTAVDRVRVLGSPDAPLPDRRIVTRDHVRPHWEDGRLVLAAIPAAGGTLVPFEVPDPTPCCPAP
ncbi:hypothetical protein AB0M28_37715 [Streptomyces sp. NPDC051940]|uniref:hypothetical protein n=1 Tax=Streptomyces sp. NPDC051940 TaxID=3155675 RepID=UPI0034418DAE